MLTTRAAAAVGAADLAIAIGLAALIGIANKRAAAVGATEAARTRGTAGIVNSLQ